MTIDAAQSKLPDYSNDEYFIYYHEGGEVYNLNRLYGRPSRQLLTMALGMVSERQSKGLDAWVEVRGSEDDSVTLAPHSVLRRRDGYDF